MKAVNRISLAVVFAVLLMAPGSQAQDTPRLREADRIRIAEAFKIGGHLSNRLWKNWDKAPFAVLLVTSETEFLIHHPKPSNDFALVGHDSLLRSDVYYRKRVFATNLLATFPAVGGVPTIVIGQPENTSKKNSTDWVITLLHEHFHQLQYSQPDYYADVNALELSGGDQSGMWMLNYPFPYSAVDVKEQFGRVSRLLAEAVQSKGPRELRSKVAAYLEARRTFIAMLTPADYKYFSFQVWQEGVARYTELRVAEIAARTYRPSRAFRALADYKSLKEIAKETRQRILKELTTLQLDEYQRVAFYPLGAGEAMLLDRKNPSWKLRYFSAKFYLEEYFPHHSQRPRAITR